MNANKRYYIAYGSNLSTQQMAHRCPDARIAGTAILKDWQLLFKRFATIAEKPQKNTPVLIWEITPQDEKNLDRYEGFPTYYFKKDIEVEMFPTDVAGQPTDAEPETVTAMVYIMDELQKFSPPSSGYYKVLEDGYTAFHFPKHILRQAMMDSLGSEYAKEWLARYNAFYGEAQ